MKVKGLKDITQELTRQIETKRDLTTDAEYIEMNFDESNQQHTLRCTDIEIPEEQRYLGTLTDTCHSQIGTHLEIPSRFYNRCKEDYPELLRHNVNYLNHRTGKRRTIRMLDNKCRAYVSPNFKFIENADVMVTTLEELKRINNDTELDVKITDATLTDTRLYIKAVSEKLTDTIYGGDKDKQVGDAVYGGLTISNSEIGFSRFKVMPFMTVIRCTNGIISDKGFARKHLGKARDDGWIEWSQHTNTLEDELLLSQIKDTIDNCFDKDKFSQWVDRINGIASKPIKKPTIAINNLQKAFNEIPKEHIESLIDEFSNYGNTQFGLSQAVTSLAQKLDDYDKQVEYEKVGGKILEMPITTFTKEVK